MTVRLSASQPGATFKGNCICIACSIIEQLPASAFYSTNCLGLLLLHKDQLVVDQCSSSSNYILIHCFMCFFCRFPGRSCQPAVQRSRSGGQFRQPGDKQRQGAHLFLVVVVSGLSAAAAAGDIPFLISHCSVQF